MNVDLAEKLGPTSTALVSHAVHTLANEMESNMRILKRLLASVALIVSAPYSAAQATVPATKVTAPNGSVSVIIGSIHAPVDGLPQPADSVFKGFSRYVVEGTGAPLTYTSRLREQEVGTERGTYAAWTLMLEETQRKVLMERVQCLPAIAHLKGDVHALFATRLYVEALTRKSTFQAAGYAAYRCTRPGVQSRDQILENAARRNNVPQYGLEDPDEVEERRSAVDERIYKHQLRIAFHPSAQAAYSRAVAAIANGRYEDVNAAVDSLAETAADAAQYNRLMVSDRNHAWLKRLTPWLDEGGAFVNVGAAHLSGPDGLLPLLASRGYLIENIQLPARGN